MDVLYVCVYATHPQKSSWHNVSPTTHWAREISFHFILVNNERICVCVRILTGRNRLSMCAAEILSQDQDQNYLALTVYVLGWRFISNENKYTKTLFLVFLCDFGICIRWFHDCTESCKCCVQLWTRQKFYPIWQKREKFEQMDGE